MRDYKKFWGKQINISKKVFFVVTIFLLLLILQFLNNNIRAITCGLISLLILYYIIYLSLKEGKIDNIHINKKEIIISIFILCAIVFILLFIISNEKFIYFWDYGCYWYRTLSINDILFENPLEAMELTYKSINNDEYNLFISLLLSIPLKLCGGSYFSFVLINFVLFYIPTNIVLGLTLKKVSKLLKCKELPFYIIILITSMFPIMYAPTLYGYADNVALLMVATCFFINIDRTFNKLEYKKDILTGILLLITLLLRRYYLFFSFGFVIWLFFQWKIYNIKDSNNIKLKDILIIGFCSLGILVVLFPGLTKLMFFNNYIEQYQSYNVPLIDKTKSLLAFSGLLPILLIISGIFLDLRKKRNLSLPIIISVLMQIFLFFKIHSIGLHHCGIMAVQIILLTYIAIINLYNACNKKISIIVVALSLIIVVLNFGISLCLFNVPSNNLFFTSIRYSPRIRNDINEIQKLSEYLEEQHEKNQKSGVYVIASSEILNDNILLRIKEKYNNSYLLYQSSHIDTRDGFNLAFFDSDIVIVCNPLQIHIDEQSQQVISLLYNEFMNEKSIIRDNYELTETFVLDTNVIANIFIKTQEFSKDEIEYLKTIYVEAYRNVPKLFEYKFNKILLSY